MTDPIKIKWTGKTRDLVQGKMLASYEMDAISEEAYRAFADYKTIVKIPESAVDEVLHELEHSAIGSEGTEGIDSATVHRKMEEIANKR